MMLQRNLASIVAGIMALAMIALLVTGLHGLVSEVTSVLAEALGT